MYADSEVEVDAGSRVGLETLKSDGKQRIGCEDQRSAAFASYSHSPTRLVWRLKDACWESNARPAWSSTSCPGSEVVFSGADLIPMSVPALHPYAVSALTCYSKSCTPRIQLYSDRRSLLSLSLQALSLNNLRTCLHHRGRVWHPASTEATERRGR
ncbi:hypothetical protein LIA77_01359 [Sarocladium implicatum]|nr:hypothetical protein LIA77_01359 [Sarocladium implicatum]